MDSEISQLRELFEQVPDTRSANKSHSLPDMLMCGFAMFSLKYPSLLDFEQQTTAERENLSSVFGVGSVCSDAQLRAVLDKVDPVFAHKGIVGKFSVLRDVGILKEYAYPIGGTDYLILSCDGVEHFSSKGISCPCCLSKVHRDGQATYHHAMLCGVLVHPDKREVFPIQVEPIIRQDGTEKNDCERNAAKRFLDNMGRDYQGALPQGHKFLSVEDALYANGPHIDKLVEKGHSFILNVKPDSHKSLFAQMEGRRERGETEGYSLTTPDGTGHTFEWANNLALCSQRADIRVNFLRYTQTDKKGKTTQFTWITDINILKARVFAIMKAGRSRWKIENETFNTLKNLGYHFQHNYGHGKDHLSLVLAYLMLIAFLIDQIIQACSKPFQLIEQALKTKSRLWETIRAIFRTQSCSSFHDIYRNLGLLYQVKLE